MYRATCLALLSCTACIEPNEGPEGPEEPTLLADMPSEALIFSASSTTVWVELGPSTFYSADGPCPLLHSSFRAMVGNAQMQVTHPGSRGDDENCKAASLRLDHPPAANSIVLVDDSKQITIDLDGRLASLQPQQPWSVTADSVATVRYTPADVLRDSGMKLVLEYPDEPGGRELKRTVSSDTITFVVPDRPGSGTLQLRHADAGFPKPWPCDGAKCQVLIPNPYDPSRPRPTVPIEIRPKAPL